MYIYIYIYMCVCVYVSVYSSVHTHICSTYYVHIFAELLYIIEFIIPNIHHYIYI